MNSTIDLINDYQEWEGAAKKKDPKIEEDGLKKVGGGIALCPSAEVNFR